MERSDGLFLDSDGDGLGDLPGILSKVGLHQIPRRRWHLALPNFQVPAKRYGYDISDYSTIHGPYGKVEHVEQLIKGLRERGINILLDLGLNHTSDQHEWFKESKSSKSSEKRN